VIATGLPFAVVLVALCVCISMGLRTERTAIRTAMAAE